MTGPSCKDHLYIWMAVTWWYAVPNSINFLITPMPVIFLTSKMTPWCFIALVPNPTSQYQYFIFIQINCYTPGVSSHYPITSHHVVKQPDTCVCPQYKAKFYLYSGIRNGNVIQWGSVILLQRHHTASQISGNSTLLSTIRLGSDVRKIQHQDTALLTFVRGVHRWPMDFLYKRK